MGHVVEIKRFLSTGSEIEDVVFTTLILMTRWLGSFLTKSLQAISFTALAMFGAWPAIFYLIYVAIDS